MTYIHSCSLYCERPECVKAQRDEMRDGIKRHEEMAAMASAEIADLTAELARLRAQVPVGWIGPSGFTHNTATNRMWMRESPKLAAKLSPVYAAPPAQPAEPVQRLSDEQIDAILHEAGVDEFAAIPIEYDRQVARAIESALQPGWRDIESAPKDGTDVWLHADGKVLRAFWLVKPYRETRDLDGNYIDHQDYDEHWMSCADGDEVEDPTEWQPLVTPLPPKATK